MIARAKEERKGQDTGRPAVEDEKHGAGRERVILFQAGTRSLTKVRGLGC